MRSNEFEKMNDRGVVDKRLLVYEGEFSSALKVGNRDGNTLTPVVRNAWDTGNLNTLAKNNPNQATGAHVSIVGHITRNDLLKHLNENDAANGYGNRFLWVYVRRSKLLPEGGNLAEQDLTCPRLGLQAAVEFARGIDRVVFDDNARRLWYEVYPKLSEGKPGLLGAMIARAEAQVVRIASIYALLDCSSVIRVEHLKAALAVWRYCEQSARYIFGGKLGDPVADQILNALRGAPEGMTKTDLHKIFGRHKNAGVINLALNHLRNMKLARPEKDPTPGRTAERWFAVNGDAN